MWQASWEQLVAGTAPGAAVEISGCASSERLEFLAAALAAAQAIIGPAVKDVVNEAFAKGGKSGRYADLAAFWEAWQKAGPRQGLAVIQLPSYDGQSVTVITRLTHGLSGQWIQSSLRMPVMQQSAQGVGSAITYARRYALGAIVGIAPDEDDDGNLATNGNGKAAAAENGNGKSKHPAAEKAAAKLATAGGAPKDLSKVKAEILKLLRSLCGAKHEDGSWDDETVMSNARTFLVSANEDGEVRVPIDELELADISKCTPEQFQRLLAWLQKEALQQTPEAKVPF